MHIGLDARLDYYRKGGITTYIRGLVHQFERLDSTNRYTIFHSRKASERVSTKFERANLWTPAHHKIERTALSIELARFGLDVLHSPDFIPPRYGAKRHVISVHDLSFLIYPQFMTAESRGYYNDQIRYAVQHADHILSISDATKHDLMTMLNVPAEKITVHHLGKSDIFTPQDTATVEAMRQQLDLPERYILFVGTFEPRKNIVGLLRAYRQLLDELGNDTPALVLAGRHGWLFDETQAEIDRLQIGEHILWREDIPQQTLPALYSGATVHTMPSFYEGFGLPALEAMACGTLSIVSNRASLPEVVGDVGILVDPDDDTTLTAALHRAITDDAWRTEQEQAAIQQAAKFTWEKAAQIALAVYQRTLE